MQFISMRQEMLLEPVRNPISKAIMIRFIESDFAELPYASLYAEGKGRTFRAVNELMGKNWLCRVGERTYAIHPEVADHLRDSDKRLARGAA